MKPPDLIGGVFSGLIVAVVLAVAGLVWNWTSGGGVVRALGGVPQTELSDDQPLKLWQRVGQDSVSEAFAQCNSDEMQVGGARVVVEGVGLMFSAGTQFSQEHLAGRDGYHCFETDHRRCEPMLIASIRNKSRLSH
jgi:hypothetical protein